MHALGLAPALVPQAQELLSFLLSARTNFPRSASHGFRRGDLWALGISGDHPVLLLRAGTAEQTGLLRFVISAQALWRQRGIRSEEHTSELQSLMRNSYAVFCLKQKTTHNTLSNTLTNSRI